MIQHIQDTSKVAIEHTLMKILSTKNVELKNGQCRYCQVVPNPHLPAQLPFFTTHSAQPQLIYAFQPLSLSKVELGIYVAQLPTIFRLLTSRLLDTLYLNNLPFDHHDAHSLSSIYAHSPDFQQSHHLSGLPSW